MIDDTRFFEQTRAAYLHACKQGARIFRCNDVLDIAVDPDGEPYVLLREHEGLRWDRAIFTAPAMKQTGVM